MKRENVEVMCIGLIPSGCAFAVCMDDGAQVFIPSAVSLAAGVSIGDRLQVNLIPNVGNEDKTPWFAYHVVRLDAEEASRAEPEDELLVQVERLMLRTRGYFTTEEVADACGVDPVEAQAKLDHLFTGGHIRRAAVQRVPNGDVELTLWAMNVADFLAEDE